MQYTKYKLAFEGILGMKYTDTMYERLSYIEKEGYYEKSICYVIWKSQDKLMKFKKDERFWSILHNEVRIHCYTKDDERLKLKMKEKENRNWVKKEKSIAKSLNKIQHDENDMAFFLSKTMSLLSEKNSNPLTPWENNFLENQFKHIVLNDKIASEKVKYYIKNIYKKVMNGS